MRRCRALLAAILSLTACSGGSSRGPIVLGLAGPFSQPRGVSMQHATELAVKEINARGGIRGRPLALRVSFTAEFKRLGGDIVEADPILSATSSLEPYLSRLRQEGGPDALMLATDRVGAELALREMGRMGVHWTTLGGDALSGIEKNGPLAEGVRISVAYLVDQSGERNAQFVAAYARAYPGERPDHRGASAYDIVQLLASVLTEVGTDRRAIRDRVARVGGDLPAFEGVTGTIAFDARGDVPAKSVLIGVVRDGLLTPEPGQ